MMVFIACLAVVVVATAVAVLVCSRLDGGDESPRRATGDVQRDLEAGDDGAARRSA
jgi:hypothetical protein